MPDPGRFKANLGQDVLFPKRLGHPEELASLVNAFADSYFNGEAFRLDGGLRMPPK